MRTLEAFLAASLIDYRKIKYVKIKNLKCSPCTIYHPWESKNVLIDLTTNKQIDVLQNSKEFTFTTQSGHEIPH